MKKLLLPLLLLFIGFATAQESQPLTIGTIQKLHSQVLNEDRTLNIYLPPAYDASKAYPVIYLLDGSMNEDFLHVAGLVQFFNLQFKMPETIFVGIANVDRKRDFTFHTDLKDLQKDYPTTGHSDKFIAFVETELLPYIEKNYKTNGTKYLMGQSLGGLLASEILLYKPQLFTHYFIVSPSLWWDDESLLKKAPALWNAQPDREQFVYLSVGAGEHKVMVRDAQDFYKVLQQGNKKKTKIAWNLMGAENHATILHRSLYDGLLQLFPAQP